MREPRQGCLRPSGDLTRHMSTEEAARDIDILRAAALDQDRLAYFGASYGTFIGATYADLFPERVGRMVLDGAVDPTLGVGRAGLVQAKGFEVALRAYVDELRRRRRLLPRRHRGRRRPSEVRRFLDEVDADPLPATASAS